MIVQEILRTKGCEIHSIGPQATLEDVVNSLVAKNCGSLLVMDQERLVGIITERDILRACAGTGRSLKQILVHERMTREPIVGSPQDELGAVMGLLTEKRIRHLPIVNERELIGVISIGDVVKAQHDQLSLENHFLKNYIQS